MSELQAAIEFQVELSKFYNVDLFQRGHYQLRLGLKSSPKTPAKIEVSLPRNSECDLVFPASVINGVAVSKTFQILYRNEDVTINDVIVFKVYMLVDSQKIIESIDEADFQLAVEIWFTDEDVGPEQQEKLQCISQRVMKLHLNATKGLHHHVPLLFDYFHLATICITVHATLLALHQPYINLQRQQLKSAWAKGSQSTMETVLFGPTPTTSTTSLNSNRYALNPRLQQACQVHRNICNILLSAYESLQASYESLLHKLPSSHQISIEHVDCHKKLSELSEIAESFEDEEDLFQVIQSTIAQLCAQNVILWTQYTETMTLNIHVTHHLAREHHTQRVKRFSEGFFVKEHPKQDMLACYDNSSHGHSDLATIVRASHYYQSIPLLVAECPELDGDETTLPIIFEDMFCEANPSKHFHSHDLTDGVVKGKGTDLKRTSSGNSSSYSGDSSSPKFRRSAKLKIIKNVRPETLKRPSMYNSEIRNSVAFDQTDCTLVGYRKLSVAEEKVAAPTTELGTLSPDELPTNALYNAVSMPTLLAKGQAPIMNSGSMPELRISNAGIIPVHSTVTKTHSSGSSEASMDQPCPALLNGIERDCSPTNSGSELSPAPEDTHLSFSDSASAESPPSQANKLGAMVSETSETSLDSGYSPNGERTDSTNITCKEQEKSVADINNSTVSTKDSKKEQVSNDVLSDNKTKESERNSIPVDVLDVAVHVENEVKESEKLSDNSPQLPKKEIDECDAKTSSLVIGNVKDNQAIKTEEKLPSDQKTDKVVEPSSAGSNSNDTKARQVEDNNSPSPTGQCTVLELLKEEYEKTQEKKRPKRVGLTGHSRDSLSLVGMGALDTHTMLTSAFGDPVSGSQKVAESKGNGGNKGQRQRSGAKVMHQHSLLPPQDSASKGSSHMVASASLPELSAIDQGKMLVSLVPDKTISFITSKENFRKQLRYTGHIYSDFPNVASDAPYYWPSDSPRGRMDEGIHLIICVHGLDGNSADLRLVRTYLEMSLPGEKVDFLMSERNQPDTFSDFDVMTDRLVEEILDYMGLYTMEPERISFVGHSLGNLIVRSALSHQRMAPLLPKLHTFLSLSGPHLGTLYNSSGLVNMGMWFMQKWKKSGSLLQLSLKDHSDPRRSFLYKLSQKTGLEFFRNILLVSSQQDRYVPYHSSRIELCKPAVKDGSGMGAVYAEMVSNILQPIVFKSDINFIRFDVFHALPSNANTMIGRAAHIAVLDSELFIEKFFTVSALKYFK